MQPGILFVTVAAALLQGSHANEVSIKLPYLSPAGVTYINNAVPRGFTYAFPAGYEAQHFGYAAAQVPAVAAVPYIKHIPTVSHIPVTKIETHPVFIQKQIDVAKPALSTRKYEVRHPAIQKQFYDVEERVIVRPAGSAVVELSQSSSQVQTGPTVIQHLDDGAISEASSQSSSQTQESHDAVNCTSSSPSQNGENVVVENPDLRKVQDQIQRSNSQEKANLSETSNGPFIAHDPSPSVITASETTVEEDKINQNRLIDLLSARGNVAELRFGGNELTKTALDEANSTGRVVFATQDPDDAKPADERVSTRRVVISRPIETRREVSVVEPTTRIEKVTVQQPTLIKTARLEHIPVHGSVPVIGKAYAPTVAHAAIPYYQKTFSPAYDYYH